MNLKSRYLRSIYLKSKFKSDIVAVNVNDDSLKCIGGHNTWICDL